jgi:LPS-assembly protein
MSWFSAALPKQHWAYALGALVVTGAVPAHAQNTAPLTAMPPVVPAPVPPAPVAAADESELPVVAQAHEISGRPERVINFKNDVEITRGPTRVKADSACYDIVEDEVTAEGNVRMWRYNDRFKGDKLELNLSTGQGYVLRPEYYMAVNNGQGGASRMDFLSRDMAVVLDATYSTCEGTNPDWYLKADTLRLDEGRDVGVAGKTMVYFKGVPIIGAPGLSFSLSGARRSGWLPPTPGFDPKGHPEIMVPYYFNIAPNRDLTVYPRMIFRRGLQLGATGRYIGETSAGKYSGQTHAEVLVNDGLTNTNRWYLNSVHEQAIARDWSYGWNVRGASDDDYPTDFSRSITTSAERQLLRELRTDYRGRYWWLAARVQGFQVLQDPASRDDPTLTVARPYDRLPEVLFHAGRFDVNGFDWAIDGEVTRFWHPELTTGNRAVMVSQLSYPVIRPGWFVTPKLQLHASAYSLDRVNGSGGSNGNGPRSLTRNLPTFSLDSGLVFERPAKLAGDPMTQTLEPRLFYVYTPYKDQSLFPNFDAAEASFNFAQLFAENRFIGNDRVSDANQVTLAVVSRFIEANGAERLRLAMGQRFYLTEQRVQLVPNQQRPESRSDVLLAASGAINEYWTFDSAVEYNASASSVVTSNYGVQWRPGDKKVVNAEYRYLRDAFKNLDVSSQWPLSMRWYGVGRVSYSLRDKRVLESLIGLEYKADCWVFRMGAQRFVTTANTTSTPIFFQLELTGLSKLGIGSPLESFYKSIPGYSRVNMPSTR